jgi:hypothetical protein
MRPYELIGWRPPKLTDSTLTGPAPGGGGSV